jgi:hypothetical protein
MVGSKSNRTNPKGQANTMGHAKIGQLLELDSGHASNQIGKRKQRAKHCQFGELDQGSRSKSNRTSLKRARKY